VKASSPVSKKCWPARKGSCKTELCDRSFSFINFETHKKTPALNLEVPPFLLV
jgi:hypothetical protein